jgi:hypothetical protein
MPQAVPSHVAEPFVGTGHEMHDGPQRFVSKPEKQ